MNKTGINPNGWGQCLYVEPEPNKPTEVSVYHPGPRPIPEPRRSQMALKSSMAGVAEYSLKVAAKEFLKFHGPKISKLKGGYSANATLIFNSWLKDINMCAHDLNLTEHEAVQLLKDFTTGHTLGAAKLHLDMKKCGVIPDKSNF